jgi:MYND finger
MAGGAARVFAVPRFKPKIRSERLPASPRLQIKRHQRKDRLVWVPRRCEVEGCTAPGPFKACARCSLVRYCGREHQELDWERHKVECKALAKLGLWGCTYDVDKELEK